MIKGAGLFVFPWDFVDEGVDELVDTARNLRLTHLIVASVYHAGFFLYPHNPRRWTHLLEDGVAYFHPETTSYESGPIRPQVASMCRDRDWFAVICDRAIAAGLKICAWTVVCHNTRIGLTHPDAAIQNAKGDVYPHALSPGHPATVAYATGLIGDLCSRYPLDAVLLEAVDYRKRKHGGSSVAGHHHERDGIFLRPLELELMDMCFNAADVRRAEARGIDVQALRESVVEHLTRYFEMTPSSTAGLCMSAEEFANQHPALVEYRECLDEAESALVEQLRAAAHRNQVRVMGDPRPEVDVVSTSAYGQSEEEAERTSLDARARLLEHQELAVMIHMGYQPAPGITIESKDEMVRVTGAVARGGADFVGYYVYAEAPRRAVDWIRPALAAQGIGD